MKIAATVARIVLGLLFAAAGASGFFLIAHGPPPMPGLAGQFQDIFFRSGWVLFVDGVEAVCGVLLLANRYVPLALTALAAVIANILTFHITMLPSGIAPGAVALVLWLILAWRHRASFAPLLEARPRLDADAGSTTSFARN